MFRSLPSPPTLFPTYLVSSLPFRRPKSCTDSSISSASSFSSSSPTTTTPPSYPSSPPTYLTNSTSHLRCARCLSDLAHSNQIISKGFTGRHGRAYLVAPSPTAHSTSLKDPLPNLPNTYTHKPVPRQLVTGAHTVGDISCARCGSVLGWKYIAAEEEAQKYKVGKFILETRRICRSSGWEVENAPRERKTGEEEDVEFDSQDEDECEALFAGMWTPQVARELRGKRKFE